MEKWAEFSKDEKFRYVLSRIWDSSQETLTFIGVNPSIADKEFDDPTIKKLIKISKNLGYGGFYIVNLFAFISSDPSVLSKVDNPIGEENDTYILTYAKKSNKVVAIWGNNGTLLNRNKEVEKLLPQLYAIGITKSNHPIHPLYQSENSKLIVFQNNENQNLSELEDEIEIEKVKISTADLAYEIFKTLRISDFRAFLDKGSNEYHSFTDEKRIDLAIKICTSDFTFKYLVHGYNSNYSEMEYYHVVKSTKDGLYELLKLLIQHYSINILDYSEEICDLSTKFYVYENNKYIMISRVDFFKFIINQKIDMIYKIEDVDYHLADLIQMIVQIHE